MVEVLCPFGVPYFDGIEWLCAESAGERVRRVSAVWYVKASFCNKNLVLTHMLGKGVIGFDTRASRACGLHWAHKHCGIAFCLRDIARYRQTHLDVDKNKSDLRKGYSQS